MDSKNTIEAALGMLTTIAFTVPGGQPLAAGLAVADFFVKLFFPDTPPPPPPPAVTPAQLHQELNDLLAKIVDALWKDSADTITTNVLARNTVLQATWDSMTTLGVNGQSFAMDGIDKATRNTITGNDTYFQWNVNPLYTDGCATLKRRFRNFPFSRAVSGSSIYFQKEASCPTLSLTWNPAARICSAPFPRLAIYALAPSWL